MKVEKYFSLFLTSLWANLFILGNICYFRIYNNTSDLLMPLLLTDIIVLVLAIDNFDKYLQIRQNIINNKLKENKKG